MNRNKTTKSVEFKFHTHTLFDFISIPYKLEGSINRSVCVLDSMKQLSFLITSMIVLWVGVFMYATPLFAQTQYSSLRAVAGIFSQADMRQLFEPEVLLRIDAIALDARWPMPTKDFVPWAMNDENPIVETRRSDELWHVVRPWQQTERLLEMYQGRAGRLKRHNPGVNFSRLLAGEVLLVWTRDPDVFSRSIGASVHGFLRNGELLPEGSNYRLLYPHRTFGTFYTVSEMVRILDLFKARYPNASEILIGDISFRRGGSMEPHVSHTSGRDIDFSYPRDDEPATWKRFQDVTARTINTKQTLFMLKSLLASDQVDMIFMDRKLQRVLVLEAKREGAPQQWIDAVFQYPDRSGTGAIVRHSKGHINHMHVRFKCQPTDIGCAF